MKKYLFWQQIVFSSYSIFLSETLDFLHHKKNQTTDIKIFQSDKRLKQFFWVSWPTFFTFLHVLVLLYVILRHITCPMMDLLAHFVAKTVSIAFLSTF